MMPLMFVFFACFLLFCSPLPEGVVEKDLYQVLGLREDADNSVKTIKKAYRKLAQIHHPDKVLSFIHLFIHSFIH